MEYIKLIEQYLGKIIVDNYQLITHGSDYDVIIYEGMIYRFPKPGKVVDLMLEKRVLDTIRPYVSLPIPNFTIVDDSFIVYPCIEGKILNDCEVTYSDEFVDTLVGFIKQIHTIPVHKFDFLQSKDKFSEKTQALVESLKNTISTRLVGKVSDETITRLHIYIYQLYHEFSSPSKAFVHSDLQGDNIIYDEQNLKIVGIIDFADSRIGWVELDFCRFAYKGDNLLERMVIAYLGCLDQGFVERAKFLAKKTIIRQIKNDDLYQNNFEYIIKQLKRYEFM